MNDFVISPKTCTIIILFDNLYLFSLILTQLQACMGILNLKDSRSVFPEFIVGSDSLDFHTGKRLKPLRI